PFSQPAHPRYQGRPHAATSPDLSVPEPLSLSSAHARRSYGQARRGPSGGGRMTPTRSGERPDGKPRRPERLHEAAAPPLPPLNPLKPDTASTELSLHRTKLSTHRT